MSPRAEAGPTGRLVHALSLAPVAAAISVLIQGFAFGVGNNVFHIPLVLNFASLPAFADDPFVASLRRFVSPVYPLLSLVANEDNVASLFFLCHAATRILLFAALFLLLQALGARGWRLVAAAAALTVSRGIYGVSHMGGGGMILGYFTHSELSTGFALLGVVALVRGHLIAAGLLGGIAFAVNVFVGVWMAVPLGLAGVARLAGSSLGGSGGESPAARWRAVSLAALAYAVPAAPVAVWAMGASGQEPDFDYRNFLGFYFGQHFFIGASRTPAILQCVSAAAAGVLALPLLSGVRCRRIASAFTGFLLVLAGGIVVGGYASSRLLLNLHLLRVDAVITMLAATLVAVAAARSVDAGRPLRSLLVLVALAGVVTGFWPVAAGALGLVVLAGWERVPARMDRALRAPFRLASARPNAAIAAASLLFLTYAAAGSFLARPGPARADRIPPNAHLEGFRPVSPEWREVQAWARANTPETARFLLPLWPGGFRVGAKRVAWVDWKEGATAMWAPGTHAAWRRRVNEVGGLRTGEERMAYACAHGLDYVVTDLRGRSPGDAARPLFRNRFFSVEAVRGCEGNAART